MQGVLAQYRPYLPATAPMGCALAIVSDVPLGGGLSSSASLEVAIATLVEAMFHHDLVGSRVRRDKARGAASALHELDGVGRALRCQRAEHEFAHMPCACWWARRARPLARDIRRPLQVGSWTSLCLRSACGATRC